jgi:hypothetical protein
MRAQLSKLVVLTSFLTGSCCGCGTSSATPVALIPVKGKVTYKGQPVTKGVVRFDSDYGRPASGQIQADGTFELTTLQPGDGVVAGEHRVYLSGLDKNLAKDRALQKYSSPSSSKLTAEVSPEKTEFTFDLK